MNHITSRYLILFTTIAAGIFLTVANWKSSSVKLKTEENSTVSEFSESAFLLAVSEDIADLGYDIEKQFPTALKTDIDSLNTLINKSVDAGLASAAALYYEKIAEISKDDTFTLKAAQYLIVADKFSKEANRGKTFLLKAKSLIEQYLANNPDNSDAKILQGYLLVRSGSNPMEGIAVVLSVLKDDPENLDALYMLGDFSIESGQYEKALERFKNLVSLRPLNPEYYFKVSEVFSRMNQNDSADFYLKKGVELRKKDTQHNH